MAFRHQSAVFLALLVALVGAACIPGSQNEADTPAEIVVVERGAIETSVTAVGSVRPGAQAELSFQIGGLISEVLALPGQEVREGDALVRLDDSHSALQIRSAQASLEAARAQLSQVRAGPKAEEVRIAEGQLAAAQAALDQAIAQRSLLITGTQDSEIVLAQTQVDAAQSRVTQLLRQVEQARAQDPGPEVEIARVEVDRAKIALDEAQDEYNKALDRPWEDQQVRDGWAKQVQQAQLTYRQAQAQLQRALNSEQAFSIGLQVLQAQVDEARSAVASAQAQLQEAMDSEAPRRAASDAAVEAARAQRDIAEAQLDLLLVGATEYELAAAQSQVDQAQVALERAQLELDLAKLEAPLEGIVSEVSAEVGEAVAPQMPVVTLVSRQGFSVEADVDEADISWLQRGQAVKITFDAFPDRELTGHILSILPTGLADLGIVSYRTSIAIEDTDLPLRSGMTANVVIVRESRQDVLLIPNRAIWIDSRTGKPFVERISGETTEFVLIEQGVSNDEVSEVTSGLQEGEQLAVRSSSVRDRFRDVVTGSMTGQ
jgi:RND family efflux transporter MFP subunit